MTIKTGIATLTRDYGGEIRVEVLSVVEKTQGGYSEYLVRQIDAEVTMEDGTSYNEGSSGLTSNVYHGVTLTEIFNGDYQGGTVAWRTPLTEV